MNMHFDLCCKSYLGGFPFLSRCSLPAASLMFALAWITVKWLWACAFDNFFIRLEVAWHKAMVTLLIFNHKSFGWIGKLFQLHNKGPMGFFSSLKYYKYHSHCCFHLTGWRILYFLFCTWLFTHLQCSSWNWMETLVFLVFQSFCLPLWIVSHLKSWVAQALSVSEAISASSSSVNSTSAFLNHD